MAICKRRVGDKNSKYSLKSAIFARTGPSAGTQ